MNKGQYCHFTLTSDKDRTCLDFKGYHMDTELMSRNLCNDSQKELPKGSRGSMPEAAKLDLMTDREKESHSRHAVDEAPDCPIKPKKMAYLPLWLLGMATVIQLA